MMRRVLGAEGASNIIKVCPQNVIFQRRAWAGSRTDDRSTEGTKHCSIWERRDEGLRARIPLGRQWREREVKREVMLGWWSQPASFSSPAIKLNPPWNPHQSRWLLLASEKGWWHERREGIGRGVGAIDNGCLFISQNKMAKKEQRTINGCYASLICVSFLRPHSWQSLMRAAITVNQTCQVSSEYPQLWKTWPVLFFFNWWNPLKEIQENLTC